MVKRILVTDYDNCAFGQKPANKGETFPKATPHLLSAPLLEFAKKHSAFYGETHRCYDSDQSNIEGHIRHLESIRNCAAIKMKQNKLTELQDCTDFSEINTDDEFVSVITENLKEATGLPCIKVSTPDDENGKCGSGYKKILKVYEEAVLKTKKTEEKEIDKIFGNWTSYNFEHPDLKFKQKPVEGYDQTTKNKQLMQVVRHAAKKFPGEEIILDYVDDNETIIKSALQLVADSDWPDNVVLNIHSHDAFTASEIKLCGTISKKQMQKTPVIAVPDEEPDQPVCSLDEDSPQAFSQATTKRSVLKTNTINYDQMVNDIIQNIPGADKAKNFTHFKIALKQILVDIDKDLDNKLSTIPNLITTVSEHIQSEKHSSTFCCFRSRETILKINQRSLDGVLVGNYLKLTA